jgi:hypothetical protein
MSTVSNTPPGVESDLADTPPDVAGTGSRGEIHTSLPDRPGNGTSRTWARTIGGARFTFTAVAMPDGERRYFVSRYNGYGDRGTPASRENGMRFGCAWSRVHAITIRPERAL